MFRRRRAGGRLRGETGGREPHPSDAERRLTGEPLIDLGERERAAESSRAKRREPQESSASGGAGRRSVGSGLYGSDVGANVAKTALAEFVGTFILVFTGTAVATAALLGRATAGGPYDSLAVALAFGLALAAVVAAIGHVSGAHVNPAVTLGLAATGKFPWSHVPAYLVAQLLGAVLGALCTWLTYGIKARGVTRLGATYPGVGVGDLRALIVEILITFILVFVVISVATDERVPAAVAPVAVGFALACGVFIAGPVTGGAVNPVRALGPMIVAGRFTAVWVYIVGPIVGGVLAAVLYDRFVSEARAPQ